MVRLIAVCLGVAALSLLLPSEPSYDPWAWLVWGREIAHLELDTVGGPSWKPGTVMVTVVLAPFSALDDAIPPALWLVFARAGALLALGLAFRLAARLSRCARPLALLAGSVAVVTLALVPDWIQFAAHGSEAPLAAALMLWAIERHLDGRRGHALLLGSLSCLLRPELFPFLALYGLALWRIEPRLRAALAGAFVLIPLLWIVPEWIGSGHPLNGGEQARSEPFWSLSLAEEPWRRALIRVHNHTGLVVELLCLAAVLSALVRIHLDWRTSPRRRRLPGRVRLEWALLVLAVATAAEAALFVAMTETGFSGNPRYVMPALVLACVLGGVGAGRVVDGCGRLVAGAVARWGILASLTRPRAAGAGIGGAAGAIAAVGAIAVIGAPYLDRQLGRLDYELHEVHERINLHRDLGPAVEAAGGAEYVSAFGPVTVNRGLASHLAWELKAPMQAVESADGRGIVFRTWKERMAGQVREHGRERGRLELARIGGWRVYRRLGVPARHRQIVQWPPFTHALQGFHIRTSAGRNPGVRGVTR